MTLVLVNNLALWLKEFIAMILSVAIKFPNIAHLHNENIGTFRTQDQKVVTGPRCSATENISN